MIRIDRGLEPVALIAERSRRLAQARLNGPPYDFDGYRLPEVQRNLLEAQEFRCAYCELPIDEAGVPIEHFRPKALVHDACWNTIEPPPADLNDWRGFEDWLHKVSWTAHEGYWWLAWTWENLFYSCSTCNSQKHKGNKFPIAPGSVRLQPMDEPPGQEQPQLIDPSAIDPLDHLRFAPDRAPDGWGPIARTALGRWTIALLGLNQRPGLRTHYQRCAGQIEDDHAFETALSAKAQGNDHDVVAKWAALIRRWLHCHQDFLALRWCVFDYHFPEAYREKHHLLLPRPGRRTARKPNPLWVQRLALDRFSERLQLRVRALSYNTNVDETQALIRDLCAERPLDATELAQVLDRAPETIDRHLQRLVGQQLRYDPSDRKYKCV